MSGKTCQRFMDKSNRPLVTNFEEQEQIIIPQAIQSGDGEFCLGTGVNSLMGSTTN